MSYKFFRLFFVLILVIGMVAIPAPQSVRAAGPWYVSTTGDDSNDCLSPGTACGTINGAIGKAAAGDTINVAAGTYTGIGDEVVLIDRDITLSGGWDASFTTQSGMSTIDGEGARRGLTANNVATVETFRIQNGSTFNNGGGIANFSGTLTLNNSIVSGNSTAFGGGINNNGVLTLNNSIVIGNSAATFGGGILNGGTLILNNSMVSDNLSTEFGGGGIANSGGISILNNSTISGNSTNSHGGGLLNSGGPTGTITLNNTTVSGNSATENGGGIANFSATGMITLNYGTVTNNTSDSDDNGSGDGGGITVENSNGAITLQSSIVAGNKKGASGVSGFTADCFGFGAIISQGYNLTGSGTGCDPLGGTGDATVMPAIVFTDILGVLTNNGGLTQTHTLLVTASFSNPALNAIANGTNSCGSAPFDFDQRGITRPQNTTCDIGAFELEETPVAMGVGIDIKPGNARNRIEIEHDDDDDGEKISVAILSTEQFNAIQQVDRNSLTFGSTGDENSLNLKGRKQVPDCKTKDVNKDKLRDLVCKFGLRNTGFQLGDTEGILKGLTKDGTPIEGRDSVTIKIDD